MIYVEIQVDHRAYTSLKKLQQRRACCQCHCVHHIHCSRVQDLRGVQEPSGVVQEELLPSLSCWSMVKALNDRSYCTDGLTQYGYYSLLCPFSHLGCHLREDVSKHTFSTRPPPVDTGVPNGMLMLRNSLNDFVIEHRSGCCATEPGYAGDIGVIEI